MVGLTTMPRTLAICAALSGAVGPSAAQDFKAPEWSSTIGATSDYVFRGLSYRDERPSAQASVDVALGIFSAGVWVSNVAGEGYQPVEMDVYASIKPLVGAITLDLGVIWYTYPGAKPGPLGYDSIELKAGFEYSPAAKLTLKPALWYVPAQQNAPVTYTYESTIAYELPALGSVTPTLSSLLGFTRADEADTFSTGVDSYTYWNAGVQLAVEKFNFDIRYWDTTISEDGLADQRVVFTSSVSLP